MKPASFTLLQPVRLSIGKAIVAGMVAAACQSPYPLASTLCDDYCYALETLGCNTSEPAGCVRECERTEGAGTDACEGPRRTRNDCLFSIDPGELRCGDEEGAATGSDDEDALLCRTERRDVTECLIPGAGVCFDECLRQTQHCNANLLDCEEMCRTIEPPCQAVHNAYYGCLQQYPVNCPSESKEPDPRPASEIPCYYEALGVLACE